MLIAGPTASGKSALALALAEECHGAIINADAMQVYKDLRILSARPGAADEARAPHLLYGHVPAAEAYSVGRFQRDTAAALAEANAMGALPIFVGGTGMYFSVLIQGIADIPPIPPEVRARARARLEEIGVAALHAELMARDPKTATKLKPSDPQRVVRAYEVLEATGKPLHSWQNETGTSVLAGLKLAKFAVSVPRADLRVHIRARFMAMLEAGAVEEAAALGSLDPALPAAKTLGLREILSWQRGEIGKDEMIEKTVIATGQFAKRQETWIRHRMADWYQIPADYSNIVAILHQHIS